MQSLASLDLRRSARRDGGKPNSDGTSSLRSWVSSAIFTVSRTVRSLNSRASWNTRPSPWPARS